MMRINQNLITIKIFRNVFYETNKISIISNQTIENYER